MGDIKGCGGNLSVALWIIAGTDDQEAQSQRLRLKVSGCRMNGCQGWMKISGQEKNTEEWLGERCCWLGDDGGQMSAGEG